MKYVYNLKLLYYNQYHKQTYFIYQRLINIYKNKQDNVNIHIKIIFENVNVMILNQT